MRANTDTVVPRGVAAWVVLSPLTALVPVLLWGGLHGWALYSTQDYAHPMLRVQLTALPLLVGMLLSLNIIVGFVSLLPLSVTGFAARAARNGYQLVLLMVAAVLHVVLFALLWQLLGGSGGEGLAYAVPSAVVILVWNLLWWFAHPAPLARV